MKLTNAEIANLLLSVAQLLSTQNENPFKIKAYRRAAKTVSNLSESVDELVRSDADLTAYPGIGKAIGGAIREIVHNGGTLAVLEAQRSAVSPEVAALNEYPRLDPKRVARIYKKLGIGSVAELRERLERGEIREQLGDRMDQHVRHALIDAKEILLFDAHPVVVAVREFLLNRCGATKVEAAGDYRRRIEILHELVFVILAEDFDHVSACLQEYGGRSTILHKDQSTISVELPSGVRVRVHNSTQAQWGLSLLIATGSEEHIRLLEAVGPGLSGLVNGSAKVPTEAAVYRKLGLPLVPAELREGTDEVQRAAGGALPELVAAEDIRGELHAHTTASDGSHSIEQMAQAARARGYEYLGITDHSQSLTIAHGLSEDRLWAQIRLIDELNARGDAGLRILKSAEVDILADGSLDYSDALLDELDYTVCSIHSKFTLGRTAQTERILRAMDNRHFNILGHATGRRLLSRPGYELDIERIIRHAKSNGCFFEINSSPQRLDLSAGDARLAREAGVMIAVNTDAHSVRELEYLSAGIEQARRAGLEKNSVLNCLPWRKLKRLLKR